MSPSASVGISRTMQPHIVAVAGLVPCAASGTMISVRARSPRALVIGADHRDAGELALRAGHRRQRDAAPCRSRPSSISCSSYRQRRKPCARRRRARADGGRGTPAASRTDCRPAGCTSSCTSRADRSACRSRSSAATAACSGAPPAARTLPAAAAAARDGIPQGPSPRRRPCGILRVGAAARRASARRSEFHA